MNNAENYAAVEVKRKFAKDEAQYDLAERGERKQRNFEKPDKPDGNTDLDGKQTASSLSKLPRGDLENVALLMVLCTPPLFRGD